MGKSKLRDFDPESLLDPAPSSSSDENSASESEDDGNAGREHYADVGKSKLRKPEAMPLGPQYTGSRVSRDAIEDEDSDNPFTRGFDDEDSDSDSGDDGDNKGKEEREHENGVENGGWSDEEDGSENEGVDVDDNEEDDDMEDAESDDDEDGEDDMEDDDEDEKDDDTSDTSDDETNDISKLREMMKDQSITAHISQAAIADVAKGQAIKAQRKTFDTFLNTRIRLQKALISTNSMASDIRGEDTAPEASIEAAETAALTLLNNLTNLRSTLDSARTGEKRKRSEYTRSTPSSDIWSSIQASERSVLPHRKTILEKWSQKTRGAAVSSAKGRLSTTTEQTLTDVLTTQLQDMPRLVARTQVPRSCAPLQSSANIASSKSIYDDADIYGLLLKELLEQRSADLNASGAGEFVVQQPWQVAREAKTKKVVDTKASKGRKLRYTVHEKLQNFMAPEDRSEWADRQRDELFGSLFGQRIGLGEDVEEGSEDEEAVDAEEEGLKLFRS